MDKQKQSQKILIAIYENGGFGQSVGDVIKVVANELNLPEEKVRKFIFALKSKNAFFVEDDIIKENASVTKKLEKFGYISNSVEEAKKFEKPQKNKTLVQDDKVLATITKVGKGYVNVVPYNDKNSEYIVFVEDVKNLQVGLSCLIKIGNTQNKMGELLEVFGHIDDPISENIAIAEKYGFSSEFPIEVIDEANQIPQEVLPSQRENRTNLEHIPFVTIDPKGCKDKDDAIYDEMLPNGDFRVYVAIADVSAVVKKGSKLDKEALSRGNSCYLGGGVYPMFPPVLSNGICSLDENKPRLAVVASATITKDGKFCDENVELAVINVKKSYSYSEAQDTFENKNNMQNVNKSTKEVLDTIYKNTKVLERRYKNVLRIDSHEPQYKFSEDRTEVEDIQLSNQEYSHLVVETRMILANEIIANLFKKNNLVGVYRTHSKTKDEKLKRLNEILYACGVDYVVQNSNQSFGELLEIVKQSPARDYLMNQITRTLAKAKYKATDDETEHFGLGIGRDGGYIHFTSPIRRYADYITHYMIKNILEYGKTNQRETDLVKVCEQINIQEKKATFAESESDKYLACLWMQKHQNEMHSGYISEIANDYIVVMHNNGTVQVTIPTTALSDANRYPYKVSANGMSIKNKKHTYTVGDRMNFFAVDIDLCTRTIYANEVKTKKFEQTFDNENDKEKQ